MRWSARCGKTRRALIAQEERDKLDDVSREEMRAVELARIEFEGNVRHKYVPRHDAARAGALEAA